MDGPRLEINNGKSSASVTFSRNSDIQAAFELLKTAIPKKWADRGRLRYQFYPRDDEYGDPAANGLMIVWWGNG